MEKLLTKIDTIKENYTSENFMYLIYYIIKYILLYIVFYMTYLNVSKKMKII